MHSSVSLPDQTLAITWRTWPVLNAGIVCGECNMELNIGRLVFMMRMGNQWTSEICAAVSVGYMEKVQWAVRPAALKDVLANNEGLQVSLGRIT